MAGEGGNRQYWRFAQNVNDPNGNRISKFEDGEPTPYTYGDADQILTAGSDAFTFDKFVNMKTKVSGGNTTTYGWDFENNLVSVDYPSTANDDAHEYDGQGPVSLRTIPLATFCGVVAALRYAEVLVAPDWVMPVVLPAAS